jgi:hypothetical protein
MLKKITLLFLFCSLWSCGYTPLYLKKNDLDHPIKIVTLKGDQKLNKIIVSSLGLKEDKNIQSGYTLVLTSGKKIDVVSKGKTGNPSVYKTSVIVKFSLNKEESVIKQKEFNSSFIYNTIQNKFDLSQYQKSIELDLINEISEKIFIYIRS